MNNIYKRNLIYILISLAIAAALILAPQKKTNPWQVLDGYSDRAKMQFCEAYDYRPTGIGKLFNELARDGEPIGTTDELEEYLAEKCYP